MAQELTEYVFIDQADAVHYEMVSCLQDFWSFFHLYDAKRGMSLKHYEEMKERQSQ